MQECYRCCSKIVENSTLTARQNQLLVWQDERTSQRNMLNSEKKSSQAYYFKKIHISFSTQPPSFFIPSTSQITGIQISLCAKVETKSISHFQRDNSTVLQGFTQVQKQRTLFSDEKVKGRWNHPKVIFVRRMPGCWMGRGN